MIGIIKETQSSQVAQELENQIRSGQFPPGRKIPSIRELAGRFDVSSQVIKSALEQLERRNLVVSRPRIGVYVNPGSAAPLKRELCLLTVRQHDHVTDYPTRLMSFGQTSLWQQFNINSRAVSADRLSDRAMRYELEKFRETRPDCLLVFLPVDEPLLREFTELPFPVVFLGDFKTETIPGCRYNQIVEDTGERAVAMVNAAAAAGARSMVMIGGSAECSYYGYLLRESGSKTAAAAGLDFHYVPFSDADCFDQAELLRIRRELIDRLKRRYRFDALLLDGFREIDAFLRPLAAHGFEPGRNFTLVSDSEMHPGCIYLQSDYLEFSHRAQQLIEQVITDPSHSIGRKVISGLIRRMPLGVAALPVSIDDQRFSTIA